MAAKKTIRIDGNTIKALLPAALLLVLVYTAYSVRMTSAYGPYYPDIDTYYLFRISSYVLNNDFHMPLEDTFRYYPTYVSPRAEYTGGYYFPAATYALLKNVGLINETYANFSWWFPALIGALTIIPMYFIGKSLHSRLAGLFAAFFFAVTPAILSRNSAWYVEKEVHAALFMLVSLYFFIRAIKKSSVVSGIISGLALFVFASIWRGVAQLYVGYAIFVLVLLFVNKLPAPAYKTYPAVVLFGVIGPAYLLHPYSLSDTEAVLNIAALFVMAARYSAEKYSLINSERINLLVPAIYLAGIVFLGIGSFFSGTLAGLLMGAKNALFYQNSVIGSTVAENIPPGWGDFENQLGATYAQGALPSLALIVKNNIFDLWVVGFASIFLLLYRIYEKKDVEYWIASAASAVMMYSFWAFLKTGEAAAKGSSQLFFVASFVSLIFLVARKSAFGCLTLSLLFVSMLGSMSKIRVIFLVAPFMALVASYGISSTIKAVSREKIFQSADGSKINVFSVAGLFVIGLFLFVNFSAANVMAHNMGALFNGNWDGAMKYMRAQTPNDSVILSWWDYGYWFQLKGERASNLDGGNGISSRNVPTAQYFTGMMNETEQKFFIETMGTTHVIVDASMIGKYAAMSKIANYGNKIDAYLQLNRAGSQKEGNMTYVAYSANPYMVLVPITQDGLLGGQIVMSLPDGSERYISSLCTDIGIIPLNPPKNKDIIDGCIFPEDTLKKAFLLSDLPGVVLFASKEVSESVFTKLFFMGGKGAGYLNPVFDNGEVKIYQINDEISHKTREELLPWWDKYYGGSGLLVYDGKDKITQKAE